MTNHYHLVIETPDANLSKGMRQLNGVFTQHSNRRHGRTGHLFQGHYKAILVDGDSYLLELARYLVLNPVRAGMVRNPAAWPWSSYRAMMGREAAPEWLATDGLLAAFATRRATAIERYKRFVADGIGAEDVYSSSFADLRGHHLHEPYLKAFRVRKQIPLRPAHGPGAVRLSGGQFTRPSAMPLRPAAGRPRGRHGTNGSGSTSSGT